MKKISYFKFLLNVNKKNVNKNIIYFIVDIFIFYYSIK